MKDNYKSIVNNFAMEFEQALNKAGYITSTGKEVKMELTPDELKVVRAAVRGSLELRTRYVKLMTEDNKMKRKQKLFKEKEIPLLKSALKKLK